MAWPAAVLPCFISRFLYRPLVQALLDAAELLLPVASATEWPCAPEVAAWLTAVRDTFDPDRVVH